MFIKKDVLLAICKNYPKSATMMKEMALEKAKIKMRLYELQFYDPNDLKERIIKCDNVRSVFYEETINQIQREQSLKLSCLSN
jgi:hypothetical protein